MCVLSKRLFHVATKKEQCLEPTRENIIRLEIHATERDRHVCKITCSCLIYGRLCLWQRFSFLSDVTVVVAKQVRP